MQDDLELLWEYGRSGAQSAFATVASRYVDLIYSAALRQVRDPHVAQDVTQAVLILLMNKAATLKPRTVVPAWLLRTTRLAALDAIKLQRRRHKHERRAAQMRNEHSPAQSDVVKWETVAPIVDEALLKLKSTDRDAVVLRYLLGKSPEEIAWALGVSEQTARQRVSRALARLRDILARRGIIAPQDAIGSVLVANAVMRAPAELTSLAGTIAAPASGALSLPPAVIARGALRTMKWGGKVKWLGAFVAATVCIALLVFVLWPKPRRAAANAMEIAPPAVLRPRPARTVAQIEAEYATKSRGNTRLGWAALANDQPALEHFIAAGDNVDERSRDAQNHTPLIWASFHQRDSGLEMVRYLLDHKADVNAQQRFGWTPLIIATRSRSPRTVQLLLERGADPKIKSNKGQTALDAAKELGDSKLIQLLEARE